ncbi:MAG: asparaginase [Proteobacteria bacterium]|nr:asparaginase [Pseudomonadota bacterium]
MTERTNPALIELVHGHGVASMYRGAALVMDRAGHVVARWGDVDAPTCIRSSLKPLQARALVETGAADAFKLTEEHLALAAGSHAGEPMHMMRIEKWLDRLGLDEDHLACGAAWPFPGPSHERLIRKGGKPRRLYHNCSGKHVGFLTIAGHLGVGVEGYCAPDHPVQQAVLGGIRDLMGFDPMAGMNVDGCNAPNFHAPLTAYARAFVRLQDDAAGARVLAAMTAYPELVSGTGRFVARLAGATGAVSE